MKTAWLIPLRSPDKDSGKSQVCKSTASFLLLLAPTACERVMDYGDWAVVMVSDLTARKVMEIWRVD